MYTKSFFYRAFDGVHYPDSQVGMKYTYGMDFRNYLNSEKGTLLRVEWVLEEGLVGYTAFEHPTFSDVSLINVETPYAGSYTVKCNMHYSAYDGMEQMLVVPLIIKVY